MRRYIFIGGVLGLMLVVLPLTGCSMSPGNQMIFFPEGHPLIDPAKALRAAATEPAPLPRELDKRVLPPYTVEPGDVLLVQPADLDSPIRFPGDQPILPDGTINLGRYGQVIVAGKTVEEIEVLVRNTVQAQLNTHPPAPAPASTSSTDTSTTATPPAEPREVGPIVVRIVTRQSKVYYVLGEVNAPGAFTLNGRETVLDGIVAAGGLTERASRNQIILSRPTHPTGCRIVLPICYYEIVQLGDTSTNYQLAPGDRIYVPSRTFCEQFQRHKPPCAPCGRAQVPCALGHGCGVAEDGTPIPGSFQGPAAHFNAMPPVPEIPTERLPAPRRLEQTTGQPGPTETTPGVPTTKLWLRLTDWLAN